MTKARFGWLLTLVTLGGIAAMQAMGRIRHRVQALAIPVCLACFAGGTVLFGLASGPVSLGAAMLLSGANPGALDISLNMRTARIETDLNSACSTGSLRCFRWRCWPPRQPWAGCATRA